MKEIPKVGELWRIGDKKPAYYVGVDNQNLIFGDPENGWFPVSKEDFYSEDFRKEKL